MCDKDLFVIDLNGIGVTPQPFEMLLEDDFFSAQTMSDKLLGGRVEVSGSIIRINGAFCLKWQAKGVVSVPCDRCLDELEAPIEVASNYRVEFGEEADETDDCIVLLEGEHMLDLKWYVCESIVLALPITNRHKDGDCNAAMAATLGEYLANESSPAEEEEWN